MIIKTTLIREYESGAAFRTVFPPAVSGSEGTPLSLEFTVSRSGALHFDNRQPCAGLILDPARSLLLAAEMLKAARTTVPGALSGRTERGLAFELRVHYRFWRRHVLRSRTAVSDMGGLTRTAPDYDSNAVLFERAPRRREASPDASD